MESTDTTTPHQRAGKLLEVMSLLHYLLVFFGNAFITPILLYMLFSPLYFIPIAYFTWMIFDRETPRRHGRQVPFIRRLFYWKYLARYFPASLHKTTDLDPSKNYMFCFHPHGVLGTSGFINFCTEATNFSDLFPGIRVFTLTLNINFWLPFFREYAMALGISDVSRDSINFKLTKIGPGNSVAIVVGGAAEAKLADPDQPYRLKIRDRRGFIREALKAGSPLVPVFSFGESEMLYQYQVPRTSLFASCQSWAHRMFGCVPILFYGAGLFFPLRKEINTVVGAPLHLPLINQPTHEEINYWHLKYIEALQELFSANKARYGRLDKDLELF